MPIYVYGCQDCGAEEEHIQRFSDPPMTECSSCGGGLKKLVTSAAFHLKGGGWYKDGYASAKDASSSEGDGGGSDSSSDSSGDDAKPGKEKPAKTAEGSSSKRSKTSKPSKTSKKAATG